MNALVSHELTLIILTPAKGLLLAMRKNKLIFVETRVRVCRHISSSMLRFTFSIFCLRVSAVSFIFTSSFLVVATYLLTYHL